MSAAAAVLKSLSLLSRRNRIILGLALFVQTVVAFLDLFGVLLVGLVTALLVTSTTSGSLSVNLPTGVGEVVNFGAVSETNVLFVAACGGLVLIGKSLLNIVISRRIFLFLAVQEKSTADGLFSRLSELQTTEIAAETSQERAFSLTNGVNAAMLLVLSQFSIVTNEIVLLSVLVIGIFIVNPIVTAFAVAYFGLLVLVLYRFGGRWAERLGRIEARTEIDGLTQMQEVLANFRVLFLAGRIPFSRRRFLEIREQSAFAQAELQLMALLPKYLFEIGLVVGAILLAGTQIRSEGAASALATIAVFLVAGSRVVPSLLRLHGALLGVRHSATVAEPTFRLVDELSITADKISVVNENSPNTAVRETNGLVIDAVSFRYPGATSDLFSDVSLHLPRRSSLAVVGHSGVGKSTLLDLATGVMEPDLGYVFFNGVPISEYVRNNPGRVALVPQWVPLVKGTVGENVAIGLPEQEINTERALDALARVGLEHRLVSHGKGLDGYLGEAGSGLSGGELQRLGLARALYADPELLVLDEPTSALDEVAETDIISLLRTLSGSMAVLVVTHREQVVKSLGGGYDLALQRYL